MLKTSFLEIMRTLDKEELKRFEAFLNSPYFNTRSHVVKLFSVIKKYAPDFEDKALDKEEVWKKISPGKVYNYGIFKNIIYDITKLSERFLEVEELNDNETQRMKNLMRKLGDKHLENIFINKYNSFEKNHFKSSKFYYEYFDDYTNMKGSRQIMEAYNSKLRSKHINTEILELIILDFIARFSINYNNMYIELTELNEKPENDLINIFQELIFNDPKLENYVTELCKGSNRNYKILLVFIKLMKSYLNKDSIEYYFDLKNTLFENDKYISEDAMRRLYASLGSALDNCTATQGINKNRELFEIISHMVDRNIFLTEGGKVIPSLYLLAVKLAGYLKQTLFLEKVINEFQSKLDPDLQDNFNKYSLAFLYYSKNKFDKAMEYTNQISIDTFQMKYFLRNLQFIISYEKDDYDMFQYLSDSHRHFLSKNKSVSGSYKDSNLKFLNYTNSLFKLRESKDKTESGLMKKALLEDLVVNKQWLMEKLDKLGLND
jgi:hypothetical protein